MSGFFTRRRHNERNGPSRSSSDFQIPQIETRQTGADDPEQSPASVSAAMTANSGSSADLQESKSFFKFPRRKKATSLSKDDHRFLDGRRSMEQTRLSSQTTRFPLDLSMRPAMSTKSSSASIAPSASGAAIMAATSSLAATGSPRMELFNPLEAPVSLSRQGSTRSAHSCRSAYSTPASDQSAGRLFAAEGPTQMKTSRGRSLTYAGSEAQRKASSNGRASKFFSMSRLRRDVDDGSLFRPISREMSPPPSPAKFEVSEKAITLPSRLEDESPKSYLERLESSSGMNKTLPASILATSDDPFHHECLQAYMEQFDFLDNPLDMALRKFLMDTHLPRETQQIDRVLNAFSARYQTCNPRLYDNQVTPYVLSFALIMLHTDRFNQNNKNKMTKAQFIRNTTSEHTEKVSAEVLEYFYDNIISTPFILVEDDLEGSIIERSGPSAGHEGLLPRTQSVPMSIGLPSNNGNAFGRRSLDLYPLIMEDKLDVLRPQLGPILELDDNLSYTGTLPVINVAKLHAAFTNPATLQLVSPRSRPEAFVSENSTQNPLDSEPGLVDIQITKIGILRKKEQKKPGSKPVYREWGVMLTPSQLLLFKNIAWVRHYMHQVRERTKDEPLILTPPVHNYAPDTYMPTSDTVAIYDSSASKKNTHFIFYGRGGERTHLAASSEEEMNDWVAKINYAAAFHTIGVRIRGTVWTHGRPASSMSLQRLRRRSSSSTTSTISGSVASQAEIALARQTILRSKIEEMDSRLRVKEQQLALLQQQGRNLCTLTPIQPRTRSSVISAAGSLSAKMSWARMELVKTQCHRDILAKDLELETIPAASVFTLPSRSKTPPPASGTPKTSPSKHKLGSAVGSLMRQVSTETMRRRVNRPHVASELARDSVESLPEGGVRKSPVLLSSELINKHEFTSESMSQLFSNVTDEQEASSLPINGSETSDTSTLLPNTILSPDIPRPRTAPTLKLNLSFPKRNKATTRNRQDISELDDISLLSSPSSGRSSGHFILHGRKVSVVQAPPNLLELRQTDEEVETRASNASTHSDNSSADVFLDARERLANSSP